jgi:integrase
MHKRRQIDMTDPWVRNVRTNKARDEWRDVKHPNLELRVTQKGTKTWRLHYTRADGRRKATRLGRYSSDGVSGLSLSQARKKAREVRVDIDHGRDPAAVNRALREAPTFAEVGEECLANRALDPNHNPHSLNDDRGMLKRHINPAIGHLKIGDIRKADILRLNRLMRSKTHARKYKDGKPRTLSVRVNRVYERTRAILRWALAEDIIGADPCGGIKKPVPVEASRNVVLNEHQLKAFWTGLDGAPMEPETRTALKLSLVTAQRIGTVASIRLSDLHLGDEWPHWIIPRLRKGRSRKLRRHLVPLCPLAVELIQATLSARRSTEFLFPTTSKVGTLTTSGVEVAWSRSRPCLGLLGINIHDLRRTASERMKRLGYRQAVGLVLGHAPRGVTDIHYDTDDMWAYEPEKRAALKAWADYIRKVAAIEESQLCLDPVRPAA